MATPSRQLGGSALRGREAASPAPGAGPFRIRTVAALSGVPATTLRAWERRYGVPAPGRTASAYRLYTADDVERVRRLRALVEQGVSPSDAAQKLRAAPSVEVPPESALVEATGVARMRLLEAATRFDAPRLEAELARLSLLFDAVSLYEQIVSPLLFEVGRRWGEGTLSIAQEHFLSERLEAAVRGALKALERPEGPLVLVACLDRDQHVFGMLGAALRLAASGARVVVLGAMTPPEAVADAVAALSPSLVGLSACIAPKAPRALLRAYARACAGLPWVLGGPAAEALRAPVAKAGGFVALGAARDWQAHVRECLRAHPAA
jgi:MerR family transcriptional regulator, light-induced transcriptional regulator